MSEMFPCVDVTGDGLKVNRLETEYEHGTVKTASNKALGGLRFSQNTQARTNLDGPTNFFLMVILSGFTGLFECV